METTRDAGLLRGIGTWGLSLNIVNSVIGASIFAVPGILAASVGLYAPLIFLFCALAVGSVGLCFAEGGSRMATSGGVYGYVEAVFGPLLGYVAGTLLWFGNALSCAGIAAALADIAVRLLTPSASPPMPTIVRAVVIVAFVGGFALVNISGAARVARFVSGATLVKLLPIAIFVVLGAGAIRLENFVAAEAPDLAGFGRAAILVLFATMGMETPLTASGEVANPARAIPRALVISMLAVTTLYIAIQVIAQGVLGPALAQSSTPLADAMAGISPALRLLLLAGAGFSMFVWIGSSTLGTPRMLFAFARDGLLPRVLGRVHPRTHAPDVAIICYAAIVTGFALSGTFADLAAQSALATAAYYILGCAAAWRMARRGIAAMGPPLNFRWLGAAATVGIASMMFMIALASTAEIVGLAAIVAISAAIYLLSTGPWRVRR